MISVGVGGQHSMVPSTWTTLTTRPQPKRLTPAPARRGIACGRRRFSVVRNTLLTRRTEDREVECRCE